MRSHATRWSDRSIGVRRNAPAALAATAGTVVVEPVHPLMPRRLQSLVEPAQSYVSDKDIPDDIVGHAAQQGVKAAP